MYKRQKPDSLLEAERKPEPKKPVDLLEQESLTRFDRDRRRNAKDGNGKDEGGNGNRKKKKKNNNNRPQQAANGETQSLSLIHISISPFSNLILLLLR